MTVATSSAQSNLRSAVVAGLPLRWLEHGTGFPVVLIHGIPTGPALWRSVIPRLAPCRVIAFEMLGYGSSSDAAPHADISVAKQADYLFGLLQHLGIDEAILGGHDLGGGVAQILAIKQPQVCAGILLTNSIGYDSWPIPSVKVLRALGALIERLPRFAFRALFNVFIGRGHDDKQVATESVHTHWPPYEQHGAALFVRQIRSLNVNDTLAVADLLPQLEGVPARVVWGAADQFQKIDYGIRLASDLRAQLIRIEHGKHFTPEDHPDVIADALNELIAAKV